MDKISVFENKEFGRIRVAGTSDEPMFCLADVCKILDIGNPSQVKAKFKKGVELIDLSALTNNEGVNISNLGNTMANFINEANLYKCIFQSRKANAEAFQDWVCGEVLPAIRKTGKYSIESRPSYQIEDPIERAKMWIKEEEQRQQLLLENDKKDAQIEKLNGKIAEDASKVNYFHQCAELANESLLTFRKTAAILGVKERDMLNVLHFHGLIYFTNDGPMAYAKHLDKFFEVTDGIAPNGHYYYQTKVTPEGRKYINDNWEKMKKDYEEFFKNKG